MRIKTILLLVIFFLYSLTTPLLSQSEKRAQSIGDILNSNKFLLGKGIISGSISLSGGMVKDFELDSYNNIDFNKPKDKLKLALVYSLNVKLYKKLSLSASFNQHLNKYFNQKLNAWWLTSDYIYSIDWTSWDPNSFSFGYANYEMNRYSNSFKTFTECFSRGFLYARFKYMPIKLIDKIRLDSTSFVIFSATMRYALRYLSPQQTTVGGIFDGKPAASLSLLYIVYRNIFIAGDAIFYLRNKTKLPWDPEYVYTIGYQNLKPFKLSFSYGNYNPNQFPWSADYTGTTGLKYGTYTVSFNYKW